MTGLKAVLILELLLLVAVFSVAGEDKKVNTSDDSTPEFSRVEDDKRFEGMEIVDLTDEEVEELERMEAQSLESSKEEHKNPFMPEVHKCDGCKAIAYQFYENFKMTEKKKGGKKPLSESDVINAVETTCDESSFESYMIVEIQGKRLLSGPGIVKMAKKGSVMVMESGEWAGKLKIMCSEITENQGEEALYKQFRTSADVKEWTKTLCDGPKYCKKKDEL